MSRRRPTPRWHALLGALCGGLALGPTPALAQEAPPLAQEQPAPPGAADDPLTSGRAALAAGKAEEALALFTRAYRWRPDADSAAGLAQAEHALGRHRQAAEHYSIALSLLGASDARRSDLQARLLEQKAHVATVLLRVPGAPGVALAVDGVAVGDSPLRLPLYLDPGTHTITAAAAGRQFAGMEIAVEASQIVTVPLRELSAPEPQAPTKPLWPAFVLGALGGVGTGVGIGTLVVSLEREAEADDLGASIGSCNLTALSAGCAELASLVSERNALRNASTAGFIAGGVAAAATLGYLLIPLPIETPEGAPPTVRTSGPPPLWAAPLVTPRALGIVLGGDLL